MKTSNNKWVTVLIFTILVGGTTACQKTSHRTEASGFDKREILVDRVEDTRNAQTSAKEQFTSALEQFRNMADVDGGDQERVYDRLNTEYQRSAARAEVVRDRITSLEAVAEALFEEWEAELDRYSKASLRRDSEQLFKDTRDRYRRLSVSVRSVERAMTPVLESFQDQVLILKHNLNARAISSLRDELATIERDTAALIAGMERAIAEADAFIKAMGRLVLGRTKTAPGAAACTTHRRALPYMCTQSRRALSVRPLRTGREPRPEKYTTSI